MPFKPKDELTPARLDAVILYLAECVVTHGPQFAPFLDKLLAERGRLAGLQNPIERARAILAKANSAGLTTSRPPRF